MDFSIIQKADISAAELAMLIRYKDKDDNVRTLTRAAVYAWINGAKPNEKLYMRVDKVLSLVQAAVNAGDLPLKLGTPRAERKRLILGAVGKQLNLAKT
jgi:hypothetical protein